MRLGSRAISSALRIETLGGFDLLLVDGGWLVVHLRPVDLRLGVRICPNCRVARQHAVVQVLLDGAPLDGNMRLCRGQSLETALALRPELAKLGVEVVGVRILLGVADSSRGREGVGSLEERLGGLGAEELLGGTHLHPL